MIDITISLYYNYKGGGGVTSSSDTESETHDLADPLFPDMGFVPHPQKVMSTYGITYKEAHPRPIGDCWIFVNCDKVPDVMQPWMSMRVY